MGLEISKRYSSYKSHNKEHQTSVCDELTLLILLLLLQFSSDISQTLAAMVEYRLLFFLEIGQVLKMLVVL